jgi:hypothetical protein
MEGKILCNQKGGCHLNSGPCITSQLASHFEPLHSPNSGLQNITASQVVEPSTPLLSVWFNNRQYWTDEHVFSVRGNKSVVQRLVRLDIEVSMVSATPCDSWRISRMTPTWGDNAVPVDVYNEQLLRPGARTEYTVCGNEISWSSTHASATATERALSSS